MRFHKNSCRIRLPRQLAGRGRVEKCSTVVGVDSHLPQVLLRLAQALRTVDAVLDAAAVDGVVVLVVQQQRRHHDDIGAVRHRVAEVAQLAVVAGDHRVRVTAVCFPCGPTRERVVIKKYPVTARDR